jgi:outer membrane receptor protein involved in Fe transport
VERQLRTHQLRGEHALGLFRIDWRAMSAGATRLEPDRREYRQDRETAQLWYLSDRPEGNQRFFSVLGDDTLELGIDGTAFLNKDETAKIKVGGLLLDREREVDTRRFKYFHRGISQDVLSGDPESVFTPENIGPGSLQFEEFTQPTDNYSATQRIRAGYAMAEIPLRPWLRIMGGARMESSSQEVATFELFNPDGARTKAALATTDLLPAGTITVAPFDDLNIRGGYSRTVSRPDFRELSEAPFNDVTGGRLTFGNPELKRARIDHIDVRVEWFPSPEEVLSASVFTKAFTDPVETIVIASAQQSVTWDNAEGAFNRGIEFEYRKDLLPVLFTAGNLSFIQSNVEIGQASTSVQTSTERALQGQSPYVVNLQLGYDDEERGSGLTMLYNVFGRRIAEVGAQGAPDTYELPVHRLDLVGRQDLGAGFELSVKMKNLLDATAEVIQGPKRIERVQQGWSLGLGVKWTAQARE